MTLLLAQELAEHMLHLEASEVQYYARTSASTDFISGTTSEPFEDPETITVIYEDLEEMPDTRAMITGDRAFTCMYGSDVVLGTDTVYALSVRPTEGDKIVQDGVTYRITAWRLENEGQQMRIIGRKLQE